jgi:enterochelin esterase family protein
MSVRGAWPSGRVVHDLIESKVLRGNRPGDPHVREIPVYLPPGYDQSARKRYPVVYVLTGFTGSGRMLLNRTNFTESLDQRMDRMISTGRCRPMILVLPDCYTRYGGSQYLNSTATGRYEDHVIREVVPWVEARYRTKSDRAHRGVMGKSSGGYGALTLGMKYPNVFGAVACHSGDAYFEYCYLPDFPKALDGLKKHGGVAGFMRAFERAPKKRFEMVAVLNIVAMSACYSPNPRDPFGFDLPFDLETGRIKERVWARWLALDPVRMVSSHAHALRAMKLLFIDAGKRDEWNLHHGARILREALRRHDVRHVYEEFDDGHMDIAYRYDRSLPRLSRALR